MKTVGAFFFFSHFGIIHSWQHFLNDLNGMEHSGCGTNLVQNTVVYLVPPGFNQVWISLLYFEKNNCEKTMFEKQANNVEMVSHTNSEHGNWTNFGWLLTKNLLKTIQS